MIMKSKKIIFDIHQLKNEGYSNRKIARILGIGRNTVNRYVNNPDAVIKPREKRASILDPHKPAIKAYLEEDPTVSAPVIARKINAQGYSGSMTILRQYLKTLRREKSIKKAYLRFESNPGEDFQIDWGHFDAIIYGNTKRKLYALAVIECYSRMLYVEFTHSQKQEVLHGCLLNAFKYLGGTPKRIIVDNMLTAVTEREGRLIRFNDDFLNFIRPFHIIPKACHIRAPYEKGKIENSIKYLRRNFMPLRKYEDLTDIQMQVLDWLDQVANARIHQTTGVTPKERFLNIGLEPLPSLITVPLETAAPKVHKDFSIKFDGNTYTTPPWTIDKNLVLKADQHTLWIYHKTKQVCSYPRCWERKKRIENPAHIEQAKKLKRHGWESRELSLFAALGAEFRAFLEMLIGSGLSIKKEVNKLLKLKDQYGTQSLSIAINKAMKHKAYGAGYIENILYQEMIPTNRHQPVTLKNEALNRIRLSEPTLNDYDALILKRRKKHDG